MQVALQYDRPRQFAILRRAYFLLYRGKLLLVGMRGQDIATMLCQPRENLRHLQRSLPFSENHFGHPCAQPAVMIDFSEAQVFKGQMAKAINRVVGRKFSPAHLLEKFADGFGVHVSTQQSALGTQASEV
jgi:hypothetical protein